MSSVIKTAKRWFGRDVWRPLRRARLRGGAALRDWMGHEQNPFLMRAIRTEARRGRPLLVLLMAVLLIVVIMALAWLFFNESSELTAWGRSPLERMYWATSPSWGSNIMGFAAVATALVSALIVFYATRVRASALLRQELMRGTIEQLQLLPIAEERWLWQMTAHPLLLAMAIYFLGLPVYAMAAFSGVWLWRDVLGMALLLGWLGYALPTWSPVQWKGAARKNAGVVAAGPVRYNAAMRASGLNDPTLTPMQKMEAQRRFQRIITGLEEIETEKTPNLSTQGSTATGKNSNKSNSGFAQWFGIVLAIIFLQSLPTMLRAGTGIPFLGAILSGAWRGFVGAWPRDVVELVGTGTVIFSWPHLLARALTSSVAFFAWRIPFALLFVPLVLAVWRQQNMTMAARVSSSETFWNLRRLRAQSSSQKVAGWMILLLFFGMTWHELVAGGALGDVFANTNASTRNTVTVGDSLAVLWTLILMVAAYFGARRIEAALARAGRGEVSARAAWTQSIVGTARLIAFTALLYFGMAWLGGALGVGAVWWQRLPATVFTTGAFLLAVMGGAAVQAQLRGSTQAAFRTLRTLWFWGPVVEIAVRLAWIGIEKSMVSGTTIIPASFTFDQAPHVLLSPIVTLVALLRADLSPAVTPFHAAWWPFSTMSWWIGPLAQALLGAVMLGVALPAVLRDEAIREADDGRDFWMGLVRRVLRVLSAPLLLLWNAFGWLWAWLGKVFARLKAFLERGNEKVIARCAATDNPVFTAEVRRKAQRSKWTTQWFTLFALGLAAFLIPCLLWIDAALNGTTGIGEISVGVVWSVLAIGWLIAWGAVTDGGQAFDRDRVDGTLVFLFLTPMDDLDILRGKLWTQYVYVLPLLGALLPFLSISALMALPTGDATPLLWALLGIPTLLSTTYFAVNAELLFAVRARKPNEGSGKALLAILVVEGALFVLCGFLQTAFYAAFNQTNSGVIILLAFVTIIHGILGAMLWSLTKASLHDIRYGDMRATAKMAS